jgi:ABC-type nitrate/sulfonate/bicarbonate transport system substrate-binding protein
MNFSRIAVPMAALAFFMLAAAAFAAPAAESGNESLVLTLDWVPNTNHIGAYIARDLGYFAEEGLEVEIIQPAEASAEALVAVGQADFGYSYQESVTFARTSDDALPVVALAAVIQHNTSGFASPADRGIESVADLAGMTYGGWGSPVETAMLQTLLEDAGAGLEDVKVLNSGSADFFAVSDRDVDFSWVFEGWTMVEAEIRGVELNYLDLAQMNEVFDYYTPVIITSESLIDSRPETVAAFMRAMSRGYEYAVNNPEEAAGILVEAVPEIPAGLAEASLMFLRDEFIAEAPRWGEMRAEVWQRYADWLLKNDLIPRPLETASSYTNEFLPRD